MSGLIFSFKSLIDECDTIEAYASDFLDKTTVTALAEAKSALQNIQAAKHSKSIKWEIPRDRPLSTIWSKGESQPDSKGGHKLKAAFSFVWDLRRLDASKSKGTDKYCVLEGRASTVTTIIGEAVDGSEQVFARWTADVGSHDSPGSHFHFQVNRSDSEDLPFPKSLDIPRLPSPLMSPFLSIDFALGELFQDRWKKHALAEGRHTNRWRNLHEDRLIRFFQWQIERVRASAGSPWMALKLAKPSRDLLTKTK